MLVIQARHMGMCFGVRDALTLMRELPNPNEITVHGELVHNPVVIEEMKKRGFQQQDESDRSAPPKTPEVLITAHGVSNKRKEQLLNAGFHLHDTTCPLVRRVHKTVLHYKARGYHLVVIGKRGHVEVEGLVGDLDQYTLLSEEAEINTLPYEKIAVVNQTTARPDDVARFHEQIKLLNPHKEVVLVDTTCRPTRDRQEAVADLLERVQALVVVGGPNSNNTRQLGLKAQERGLPWWRISGAEELQEEWFQAVRIVGLTAGTSTTDETVQEVARKLRSFKRARLSA